MHLQSGSIFQPAMLVVPEFTCVIILLLLSLLQLFSIESQVSLEKSSRMYTPTKPKTLFFNCQDILKRLCNQLINREKILKSATQLTHGHQNPRFFGHAATCFLQRSRSACNACGNFPGRHVEKRSDGPSP